VAAAPAGAAGDAPGGAPAGGRLRASPLGELLGAGLPAALEGSEQTRDVLTVLKLLEALRRCAAGPRSSDAAAGAAAGPGIGQPLWMNTARCACAPLHAPRRHSSGARAARRLAPHLAAHEAGAQGRLLRGGAPVAIGREEFVSAKLAPKLAQQLKVRRRRARAACRLVGNSSAGTGLFTLCAPRRTCWPSAAPACRPGAASWSARAASCSRSSCAGATSTAPRSAWRARCSTCSCSRRRRARPRRRWTRTRASCASAACSARRRAPVRAARGASCCACRVQRRPAMRAACQGRPAVRAGGQGRPALSARGALVCAPAAAAPTPRARPAGAHLAAPRAGVGGQGV